MSAAALEALVSSLLYEGYALYPYTPGATKNATPTPFGIVYPPAYAEGIPSTFDHMRVEAVLLAEPEARVGATLRFLHAAGERHRAVERRVAIAPAPVAELGDGGIVEHLEFGDEAPLRGRMRLRAEPLGAQPKGGQAPFRLFRVVSCVHNSTELDAEEARTMERPAVLLSSLLSTHVLLEASGGRFVSPLERDGQIGTLVEACRNVNTWPVLASPGDDALLAAPILLPDHPSIAPESLGNLFDNTEIEEALLLHVQTLSDEERAEIEAQDPAIREMIERAGAAAPEEIVNLHGRLVEAGPALAGDLPADPGPEPEPGHPNPGEQTLDVDGRTFRKGGKVVLRPGTERDVYDRMLDGRRATIERLYLDYEDGAHIAVTIDDDPAQELFRDTGRYLFFRAGEVEAVEG